MPSAFEAQYRCLAELKEIDERAYRVEKDAEQIPEDIKVRDEALAQRRAELDAAKNQAGECEKKLRNAERELKEKEDSLFKAEGKMMEVKTNQEYQAAMKENESQKVAKGVLEERALKILNEVEEQKQALSEIERAFKEYESGVLAEKKKLSGEHQDLIKQLEVLLRQRQAISDQLDPQIAGIYRKIVSAGKGTAISVAEQGRCSSCNLQVRPQVYNEILGAKAIHRCSNCGKLLIANLPKAPASPDEQPQP